MHTFFFSLISGIDDKLSEIQEYANYNKEGIKLLDSLKTINEEVIEYLNKKSDDVEKIQGVFSSSDIYGELEEKHGVYLEALGEVRNTGGEDINLIQNQLQQNKNRFDELSKLQNQQAELVKKIDESIDSFIERRLDLSSKRKEIIDGLKLTTDLSAEFETIKKNFNAQIGSDYAASRGEYLNSIIMADYLGYDWIDAADGILFDKDIERLIWIPTSYEENSYYIPEGVKTIDDEAFFYVCGLSYVYIPDSVSIIGKNAFRICYGL